jgi:riboflavin synthase
MFTGIVEAARPVLRVERRGRGLRIAVAAPRTPGWELAPGQSVAVSGVCLTVAGFEAGPADTGGRDPLFDLSAETLARTWLGELEPGRAVNLERAMRLSDRLDGHLVAGHVDGSGRVIAIEDPGDGGCLATFEVEAGLERYLIEKGSVTLDGVSLTVVESAGRRFRVALIPETLARTTLGDLAVGRRVNVEADMIGKWVERLAARG